MLTALKPPWRSTLYEDDHQVSQRLHLPLHDPNIENINPDGLKPSSKKPTMKTLQESRRIFLENLQNTSQHFSDVEEHRKKRKISFKTKNSSGSSRRVGQNNGTTTLSANKVQQLTSKFNELMHEKPKIARVIRRVNSTKLEQNKKPVLRPKPSRVDDKKRPSIKRKASVKKLKNHTEINSNLNNELVSNRHQNVRNSVKETIEIFERRKSETLPSRSPEKPKIPEKNVSKTKELVIKDGVKKFKILASEKSNTNLTELQNYFETKSTVILNKNSTDLNTEKQPNLSSSANKTATIITTNLIETQTNATKLTKNKSNLTQTHNKSEHTDNNKTTKVPTKPLKKTTLNSEAELPTFQEVSRLNSANRKTIKSSTKTCQNVETELPTFQEVVELNSANITTKSLTKTTIKSPIKIETELPTCQEVSGLNSANSKITKSPAKTPQNIKPELPTLEEVAGLNSTNIKTTKEPNATETEVATAQNNETKDISNIKPIKLLTKISHSETDSANKRTINSPTKTETVALDSGSKKSTKSATNKMYETLKITKTTSSVQLLKMATEDNILQETVKPNNSFLWRSRSRDSTSFNIYTSIDYEDQNENINNKNEIENLYDTVDSQIVDEYKEKYEKLLAKTDEILKDFNKNNFDNISNHSYESYYNQNEYEYPDNNMEYIYETLNDPSTKPQKPLPLIPQNGSSVYYSTETDSSLKNKIEGIYTVVKEPYENIPEVNEEGSLPPTLGSSSLPKIDPEEDIYSIVKEPYEQISQLDNNLIGYKGLSPTTLSNPPLKISSCPKIEVAQAINAEEDIYSIVKEPYEQITKINDNLIGYKSFTPSALGNPPSFPKIEVAQAINIEEDIYAIVKEPYENNMIEYKDSSPSNLGNPPSKLSSFPKTEVTQALNLEDDNYAVVKDPYDKISKGNDSLMGYDGFLPLVLGKGDDGSSCGSNRGSVLSCDQQSNSLYGRYAPGSGDSATDRSERSSSEEWVDLSDVEEELPGFVIIREKQKLSKKNSGWSNKVRDQWTKSPKKVAVLGEDASSCHHYYESLHSSSSFDSFDSDSSCCSLAGAGAHDSGVDMGGQSQLPEPPPPPPHGLTRLAARLRRNWSLTKSDISRSLSRMAGRGRLPPPRPPPPGADRQRAVATVEGEAKARQRAVSTPGGVGQGVGMGGKWQDEGQEKEQQQQEDGRVKGSASTNSMGRKKNWLKFRRAVSMGEPSAEDSQPPSLQVFNPNVTGYAKSTFYLSNETEPNLGEKPQVPARRRAPRPQSPPPPAPVPASGVVKPNKDKLRSTSWYAECGLFKATDNQPPVIPPDISTTTLTPRSSNTCWYAEVGLYQHKKKKSNSSCSSAENSAGKETQTFNPKPDLIPNSKFYTDASTQQEVDVYYNIRNQNKTGKVLNDKMATLLRDEPLYQFYDAAVAENALNESSSESDYDGYEEIGELANIKAEKTVTNNIRTRLQGCRTLWCEIQEVIQSEILRTLTSNQRKIQEAKFEIITSEASYLNSLNVLTDHFIPKLNQENLLSETDRRILFGNIYSVKQCSEKLLTDLEACWEESILLPDICSVIKSYCDERFSVYVEYCANQLLSESVLRKCRGEMSPKSGKSPSFSRFAEVVKRLEASAVCQGLSLHSFLMLPMQRVTRLPLLIDAVLRRLAPSDDDFQSCQAALRALHELATRCNEAARHAERVSQLQRLATQLEFPPGLPAVDILAEGAKRYLVRSGDLTQLLARGGAKGEEQGIKLTFGKRFTKQIITVMLFEDWIIIARKKSEDSFTVLHHCPRSFLELSPPDAPPPTLDSALLLFLTLLENQDGKQISLLLSCSSETEKTRWVEALSPPPLAEDPNEVVYESWDCPQVQALHHYASIQPDELSLKRGDVVNVGKKMKDGWYHGERLRDGQIGWFPGNHTIEIANPHVRARNLRQRLPLLIDAVLRRLAPSDDDFQSCQAALRALHELATRCNEAARHAERVSQLQRLATQLEFPPGLPAVDILAEGAKRYLVRSGDLTQLLARGGAKGEEQGIKLTFGKRFTKQIITVMLFEDWIIIARKKSEDSFTVLHHCPRSFLELSPPDAPPPTLDSALLLFLTLLENQDGKQISLLLSCSSETEKTRWVEALSPPPLAEDPNEVVYESWDCPQVQALHHYASIQPDELSLKRGDVVNVGKKMKDGWYHGERLRDGQIGWFPGNHTIEIANPHVRARNLRQRYRLLAYTDEFLNNSQNKSSL